MLEGGDGGIMSPIYGGVDGGVEEGGIRCYSNLSPEKLFRAPEIGDKIFLSPLIVKLLT